MEAQLEQYFGFTSFRKGQKEVIETVVNRQSAAAIFPTGAGKSMCYQLPAVLLPGLTLVVSPLIALMKDQLDFLLEHNIPAAKLDSTLTREEYNTIINDAKSGKLKILMIAVERFKNERFRNNLHQMDISLMVIDEAHCISEWGHNFRPEYLKLPVYKNEFNIPQLLALTATATQDVLQDMCAKLEIAEKNVFATGFYRPNLFLKMLEAPEGEKNEILLDGINKNPLAPTIVYVTLQKTAEVVAEYLKEAGIIAHPYHAGMKNEERESIQNRFMAGEIHCITATIAFGMGIDKKDIRRVIHYDLPKSIENYSQEIGRAGRDGKQSACVVLANGDNIPVLENFIYGDAIEKNAIGALLEDIKNSPQGQWELRLTTLSNELNIRQLPLKTLLVYLDMANIIRPQYTYFEDYYFRPVVSAEEIASHFEDERRRFVETIMEFSPLKRTYAYVDIAGIEQAYRCERKRIITALEYFEQKRWIELYSKGAVEVYRVLDNSFDTELMTDKMYSLFKSKEEHGIQRIREMIAFFESHTCLSKRLALYYGEKLSLEKCGHCSVCRSGSIVINRSTELPSLSEYNLRELIGDFYKTMGSEFTVLNGAKFFCGINAPIFTRKKVKKLPNFGMLEKYPFNDVLNWIESNRK